MKQKSLSASKLSFKSVRVCGCYYSMIHFFSGDIAYGIYVWFFVNAPLWLIFMFMRLTQYIRCSSYKIYLVHFFCYLLITSVSTNMLTKPTSVFSTFTGQKREKNACSYLRGLRWSTPFWSSTRVREPKSSQPEFETLTTTNRSACHSSLLYRRVSETERKWTHM